MLTVPIEAERLELARRQYRHCRLCEHRCGVDRIDGRRGTCKAGAEARVYRHRVEYGEELELVPSHLFYLSGCDLRCAFCIGQEDAFDPRRGQPLTGRLLAEAVAWGRAQGARYLEFVGGEPTIHLPPILEAISECDALPPVVWKSNFHATPEVFDLLDGVVGVYVADFKFGNDACAERIAGVDRYREILARNLTIAAGRADLIVRHLLLPGHFDCCYRPIVDWMRQNLPATKLSIWEGYLPCWRAWRHAELTRPLPQGAGRRARALARQAGLNVVA